MFVPLASLLPPQPRPWLDLIPYFAEAKKAKELKEVQLFTKDLQCLMVTFVKVDTKALFKSTLRELAFWRATEDTFQPEKMFAFACKLELRKFHQTSFYDIHEEFDRMEIERCGVTSYILNPSTPFCISNCNAGFTLCSTYPEQLVLPRNIQLEGRSFPLHP